MVMLSDIEIAREVVACNGAIRGLSDDEIERAVEARIVTSEGDSAEDHTRALAWLGAHGVTREYRHDPQRYQTLVERITYASVETCARCRREGQSCRVLHVHRQVQADGAEMRVTFPLAMCSDCWGRA